MSIILKNIILHQLKTNQQGDFIVKLREGELDASDSSDDLVDQLHDTFDKKPSKGFCLFGENSTVRALAENVLNEGSSFADFSSEIAKLFHSEMCKYGLIEEGVLIVSQYRHTASDYLYIALLPSNHTLKITDSLDLGPTDHLAISKVNLSVRIDLTAMSTKDFAGRYISFTNVRSSRKHTDFILDFLGAESGTNTKTQNTEFMTAVNHFVSDSKLNEEDAQTYREHVLDFCNQQHSAGDEIEISLLSESLADTTEAPSFLEFASKHYELEDSFPAHKTTLSSLTKYSGQGGGVKIDFHSKLLGERVSYNQETDTLTIVGTPPNLREQLIRRAEERRPSAESVAEA